MSRSKEFIVNVDPACGEISERWMEFILRDGAKLKEGRFGTLQSNGLILYIYRLDLVALWVTKDADSMPVPVVNYEWARPLWAELEAGAETPEKRVAMARGMTARLPCGPCKLHWPIALKEHPPEESAHTPEAFAQWVRNRRNDIARRKGRPELPPL